MDAISGGSQPPALHTGTEDIEDVLEKPVVPLSRQSMMAHGRTRCCRMGDRHPAISHPPNGPPRRPQVAGPRLFALTDAGLACSRNNPSLRLFGSLEALRCETPLGSVLLLDGPCLNVPVEARALRLGLGQFAQPIGALRSPRKLKLAAGS